MGNVFVIAEAGVNHNGDIKIAMKLIDVAAAAGADAIKFQTFKAETLVSTNAPKAEYQLLATGALESQFEMIKRLELSHEFHGVLNEYCQSKNILFFSTPFDIESAAFLDKMGMKIIKIPSGEITNLPYLRYIGSLQRPVIMSTGMAHLEEVKMAIDVLISSGTSRQNLTVLHCNTEYPTPYEDVNLRAMRTIRDECDVKVGYSDHTLGIEVSLAAVAMGATVIEKHITLDTNMEGPDHKASITPVELECLVRSIRNIEKALGSPVKQPSASEKKNTSIARKSIVAAKAIKKGEVFSETNITAKRPGTGLSPMAWDDVIGQVAKRHFKYDEKIEL